MKCTTHLLSAEIRKSGATHLLPLYALVEWRGGTSPFASVGFLHVQKLFVGSKLLTFRIGRRVASNNSGRRN